MPRTHGYAARGRVNALGALLRGVLLTVSLTTSNVDTEIFNLWLEGDLLPKLPPGSVVVLDNASFHRHPDTRIITQKAGHVLEYLPPYSPDLNPIKPKWAQAKAIRRKTRQTPDQIFEALV